MYQYGINENCENRNQFNAKYLSIVKYLPEEDGDDSSFWLASSYEPMVSPKQQHQATYHFLPVTSSGSHKHLSPSSSSKTDSSGPYSSTPVDSMFASLMPQQINEEKLSSISSPKKLKFQNVQRSLSFISSDDHKKLERSSTPMKKSSSFAIPSQTKSRNVGDELIKNESNKMELQQTLSKNEVEQNIRYIYFLEASKIFVKRILLCIFTKFSDHNFQKS